MLAALLLPAGLAAQDPPPPPPDTIQLPDSLQLADSLALPDSLPPDSVSGDTIFYNVPTVDARLAEGFRTGVWVWDRALIMASGANTLAELFAELPGVIGLWGGDYGTPVAISSFGGGAGGYRVFRDGFELYPLDGGVVDLQRVALVGIARVRMDRSMGAMRIDLYSHEYDDGRPFSVIEAGTGDLDTNTFRGIFADPRALGGSVAVGLERADTRGVAEDEGGNRTGSWVRYQLHMRERAGLGVDLRRSGTQTEVSDYATSLTRTDLTLRGSYRVAEGVVAEAYTGRSTLDGERAGADYEFLGGTRTQHGARLGVELGPAWATGAFRLYGGDDLLERDVELHGGLRREGVGGVSSGYRNASWGGTRVSSLEARAWAGPLLGLSAFGSFETGSFASRDGPVLDALSSPEPPLRRMPTDMPPGFQITDRTAMRLGGTASLRDIHLSGALLRLEADDFLPLSTELDLGAPTQPGGATRTGFEATASFPVPIWDALRFEGSYQRWDLDAPFLPKQTYRAYLDYHKVHMESGNLELWWALGVRGHDPMAVFVPGEDGGEPGGLEQMPFYQNWFGRIQVRIVTVRLFFGWENFTIRRSLRTFPDRPLPYARTFFALRWDMWS